MIEKTGTPFDRDVSQERYTAGGKHRAAPGVAMTGSGVILPSSYSPSEISVFRAKPSQAIGKVA